MEKKEERGKCFYVHGGVPIEKSMKTNFLKATHKKNISIYQSKSAVKNREAKKKYKKELSTRPLKQC